MRFFLILCNLDISCKSSISLDSVRLTESVSRRKSSCIAEEMKPLPGKLSRVLKALWFFAIGLFLFLIPIPIYLILSLPIAIYRYVVCKFLAPYFCRDLGKPVTTIGVGMAVEFMERYLSVPPRWGIVTCMHFEGTIPTEEVRAKVWTKWIELREKQSGSLKYPEFQQYIEEWMGFLFWKRDSKFHLDNHIHVHKVKDVGALDGLIESLLNQKFVPKRSPWDIHLVHNYRDNPEGPEMTIFILRSHHAMMDGISVMSALVEGLLEVPPLKYSKGMSSKAGSKLTDKAMMPFKLVHDIGFAVVQISTQKRTPFHFPAGIEKNAMVFAKSDRIPIRVVKDIKNKFGVSFTSVLQSSISAALARVAEHKSCKKGNGDRMIFGTVLPLPNHPDKLRNHATGTGLKLLLKSDMDPVERLRQTEEEFKRAKNLMIPRLLPILAKCSSFHIAPISRLITRNRVLAAGLSNFPGPVEEVAWSGRKLLSGFFVCGTSLGDQGMVFMVLSYNGFVQVAVTSEIEVLDRTELRLLIQTIQDEISKLQRLSSDMKNHQDIYANSNGSVVITMI